MPKRKQHKARASLEALKGERSNTGCAWRKNEQVEEAWRHAGRLIGAIAPDECASYFENAGYAFR